MRAQYVKPDWLLGDVSGVSSNALGILPGAALVMVYGAHKCLKTFVLLDIALCIAAGIDWHGRKVKQGPVVYVVAEDPDYIMQRVDAWGAYNGVDVDNIPFRMVPGSVQMLQQAEVDELTRLIRPHKPALVIFDTLGKCMAGGKEKDNDDFHAVVRAMEHIRTATGATVLVVHHQPHDGELPRGASAMLGDMTTVIRVTRATPLAPEATLKCTTQRVAAMFKDVTVQTDVFTAPDGSKTLVVVNANAKAGTGAPIPLTPARKRTPQQVKRDEFNRLVALGRSNAEIAKALGMDVQTVGKRRRRTFERVRRTFQTTYPRNPVFKGDGGRTFGRTLFPPINPPHHSKCPLFSLSLWTQSQKRLSLRRGPLPFTPFRFSVPTR